MTSFDNLMMSTWVMFTISSGSPFLSSQVYFCSHSEFICSIQFFWLAILSQFLPTGGIYYSVVYYPYLETELFWATFNRDSVSLFKNPHSDISLISLLKYPWNFSLSNFWFIILDFSHPVFFLFFLFYCNIWNH